MAVILRACCRNAGTRWKCHFRIKNLKVYSCSLEKFPHFTPAGLQCQSVFFSTRTHLIHHQRGKDKIPEDYDLIYENRLKKIVVPARMIATLGSIASAGLSFGSLLQRLGNFQSWDTYILAGVCLLSLFTVVFVNVMFRYYLIRIYFKKDNSHFIGVYYSFLGNVRQVRYSATDVKTVYQSVPDSAHAKCNVRIGGRTFHLRGEDFVLPKYYNIHLGLQ